MFDWNHSMHFPIRLITQHFMQLMYLLHLISVLHPKWPCTKRMPGDNSRARDRSNCGVPLSQQSGLGATEISFRRTIQGEKKNASVFALQQNPNIDDGYEHFRWNHNSTYDRADDIKLVLCNPFQWCFDWTKTTFPLRKVSVFSSRKFSFTRSHPRSKRNCCLILD